MRDGYEVNVDGGVVKAVIVFLGCRWGVHGGQRWLEGMRNKVVT